MLRSFQRPPLSILSRQHTSTRYSRRGHPQPPHRAGAVGPRGRRRPGPHRLGPGQGYARLPAPPRTGVLACTGPDGGCSLRGTSSSRVLSPRRKEPDGGRSRWIHAAQVEAGAERRQPIAAATLPDIRGEERRRQQVASSTRGLTSETAIRRSKTGANRTTGRCLKHAQAHE